MNFNFSRGILLCSVVVLLYHIAPSDGVTCDFYEEQRCKTNASESACRVVSKFCNPEEGLEQTCVAFWSEQPEGKLVQIKGCWHKESPRCDRSVCENDRDDRHSFCCCTGNNCNSRVMSGAHPDYLDRKAEEFLFFEVKATTAGAKRPSLPTTTPAPRETPQTIVPEDPGLSPVNAALVAVIVVICALLAMVAVFIMIRFCLQPMRDAKKPPFDMESALVMAPLMSKEYENQDGCALLKNLQLLERKATGRYGEVWKGRLADIIVAVKITPVAEISSWKNEVHIYHKFLMPNPHPNILHFYMAGRKASESRVFLVTEYHPLGSLVELLKGRAITNEEADALMCSMLAGMAFLHDTDGKPAIAHRDFKSTNVLIKSDMTACVADFGLATAFDADERIGDKHGQVGTRRYMAPELLEGAISLNVVSFLRVDIYACGLVLWEVLSRTQLVPEETVGIHKLPLEDELGISPTNEAIQTAVVQRRVRPSFKPSWKTSPKSLNLCLTIEECWDADPEARPSASCLLNRMRQLSTGVVLESECDVMPSLLLRAG